MKTAASDPLAYVSDQYADVLQLLAAHDYGPDITETGGGCLAIEIDPIADHQVLITDRQGPLCDLRDDQTGWSIGFYSEDNGLIYHIDTTKRTATSLLELLSTAIRGAERVIYERKAGTTSAESAAQQD